MTSAIKETPVIFFVIRYFHPFVGGLEKKTLNLAAALTERGVHVEIITSRFYPSWPARDLIRNVSVCRLPSPRIKIVGAVVFLTALCSYLYKQKARIRIIHAFQVGYSSAAAILIGKLLAKPTILSLSGSGPDGDIMRHKRSPWGRVFLFFCRRASRIAILNSAMYHELDSISYVPAATVKIPNGVDLTAYRETDTKQLWKENIGVGSDKVILYAGRLAPEKGVTFLLSAFAVLCRSQPAQLYILGTGPQRSALERLLRQHQLQTTVHILPPVDDVLPYLHAADIFVMPSRSEGLSNAVLEAMACGLPVIATRVAGNTDLIEDGVNGLLITHGDESGLVDALTLLLSCPEKAAALGRQARQTVCTAYDLQDMVRQYNALYQSISSA